MSRRRYRRRRCDDLSSAVDDAAHVAAKFGPVGALWTGAIGFAVFYAALPACVMAWCEAVSYTHLNAESMHRLAKMALDSGEVASPEEAVALFSRYRLRVHLGAGWALSLIHI